MYRIRSLTVCLAIGTMLSTQYTFSIPYKVVVRNRSKHTIYVDVTTDPNSSENSLSYSGPLYHNQKTEMNLLVGVLSLLGLQDLAGKSTERLLKKIGALYLRIAYGIGIKVLPLSYNGYISSSVIFVEVEDSDDGIIVNFS